MSGLFKSLFSVAGPEVMKHGFAAAMTGYCVGIMVYIVLVYIGWANSDTTVLNILVAIGTLGMAVWAYRRTVAPPILGGVSGGCGCTGGCAHGGGTLDTVKKIPELVRSTREMLGQMDQVCLAGQGIEAIKIPCQQLQERAVPLRQLLDALPVGSTP